MTILTSGFSGSKWQTPWLARPRFFIGRVLPPGVWSKLLRNVIKGKVWKSETEQSLHERTSTILYLDVTTDTIKRVITIHCSTILDIIWFEYLNEGSTKLNYGKCLKRLRNVGVYIKAKFEIKWIWSWQYTFWETKGLVKYKGSGLPNM